MNKFVIAAVAFMAVGGGVALAQAPGGGGPGRMLAAADANHDGNITKAEYDAARNARFAEMDANHDGSVSASERPAPPAGAPQGGGRMNPDANGDGVITRAEFDAQGAAGFQRLDANHDGTISQAEIAALQQQ